MYQPLPVTLASGFTIASFLTKMVLSLSTAVMVRCTHDAVELLIKAMVSIHMTLRTSEGKTKPL